MAYLEVWRAGITPALDQFLPVLQRKGTDRRAILAAAVLSPIREDARTNAETQAEIRRICGDDALIRIQGALPDTTADSVQIVERLSSQITGDNELRAALFALFAEFVDIFIESHLVTPDNTPPAHGSITTGDIHNTGNLNIGGKQYIWGDLNIKQEAIRTCPKPPNAPEKFGGRTEDYNALKTRLSEGTTTAIAGLRGVGGIGKTTLARQLAHDLYHKDRLFKAVVWTDINQNPDLRAKLISWGKYSDQNFDPSGQVNPEDIKGKVQEMLAEAIENACNSTTSERVLVVLDDIWDDAGLDTARTLLSIRPANATVLLTTRYRHIADRLAHESIELNYMNDAQAVEMLSEYLGDTHDPDLLGRLARALGGHPLALKLAAQNIHEELLDSPAALATWTAKYEAGIPEGSPFKKLRMEEGTDKEYNLSRSLRLSYDALPDDDDCRRFRLMGILPPDVSFDGALLQALWDCPPEDLDDALRNLRRPGLIAPESRAGWYNQHRLLRAYARALLDDAGETDDAFRRYAGYITGIAAQFRQLSREQWHTLDDHLPHIHAVGDALADRALIDDAGETDWLALAGDFSWETMRYLNNRSADLFTGEGENRQPTRIRWFEMGTKAWEVHGNQEREAATLNNIGFAWSALGEKRKALEFYEQALPVFRAVGDRGGEAATLNNIGLAWDDLGEKRKALEFYEQALPLSRAVGDRGGEAATLNNIAAIYYHEGDLPRAVDAFQQIIKIVQDIGAVAEEASFHLNIAVVLQKMGRIDEAITHAEQGRAILVRYNLPQAASGATLVHYDQILAQLRGGSASPAQSTLPAETVNMLAGNTLAVMTDVPDRRDEWRESLDGIRGQFVSRGDDWANEVAFADALLNILNNQSAALPGDNPYAGVIEQVKEAINQHKQG